ncbi:unnamed protein product [Thlaspi arvense]|uniref:RNase H type-1 domain-containing protein n=1 Tax=Thlaspi arvense TaxID=13288 RepID=A0AAU9RCH7_THLAR|nr:unnamed protein product [Thlaspi arvense]
MGQSRRKQPLSAFEGELQALFMAMQHCWSKGYTRTIFEGGYQKVMDVIAGKKSNFNGCKENRTQQRISYQNLVFQKETVFIFIISYLYAFMMYIITTTYSCLLDDAKALGASRVVLGCVDDKCTSRLCATVLPHFDFFVVKEYANEHTCDIVHRIANHRMTHGVQIKYKKAIKTIRLTFTTWLHERREKVARLENSGRPPKNKKSAAGEFGMPIAQSLKDTSAEDVAQENITRAYAGIKYVKLGFW